MPQTMGRQGQHTRRPAPVSSTLVWGEERNADVTPVEMRNYAEYRFCGRAFAYSSSLSPSSIARTRVFAGPGSVCSVSRISAGISSSRHVHDQATSARQTSSPFGTAEIRPSDVLTAGQRALWRCYVNQGCLREFSCCKSCRNALATLSVGSERSTAYPTQNPQREEDPSVPAMTYQNRLLKPISLFFMVSRSAL